MVTYFLQEKKFVAGISSDIAENIWSYIIFFPFSLSAFMDKYNKDIILIPKDLITYSTFPVFPL